MRTDWTARELREAFLGFFEEKNHTVIRSSSLIPTDDSVLLTTAGMQQLVPFLSGDENAEEAFGSRRLADLQKCYRTNDIDEVGDDTHFTFFEMMGNWSIGDYFKEEAIDLAWEFLTEKMEISPDKLSVTVYEGNEAGGVPRDAEARELWLAKGVPAERIYEFGKDNFWGPTATTGPCGPSTEIFYDWGEEYGCGEADCRVSCEKEARTGGECQRYVEIWNLVFMEFNKDEKGSFVPLPQQNVDTGMGYERFVPLMQGVKSAYDTDLFAKYFEVLNELCDASQVEVEERGRIRSQRIIADHVRGACFLIADGVVPSKTDRGYILRRVLRRAIRHAKLLGIADEFDTRLIAEVVAFYEDVYPELSKQRELIEMVIGEEKDKFQRTLNQGLKKFEKAVEGLDSGAEIDAVTAFMLYDTYGFPIELVKELAGERGFVVDEDGFGKKFKEHQEVSRAGAEKKFAGVGEWGDQVAAHHSATHLLHQAVRDVLGEHAKQAGSDMNPDRLRFDVTHPEAITSEQIREIEDLVNKQIEMDVPVSVEEMTPDEAAAEGAIGLFRHKYGDKVTVWKIGEYSKEVCGGPHVEHTGQIKGFKIVKEKSNGRGVRRIKAVVEDRAVEKLKAEGRM